MVEQHDNGPGRQGENPPEAAETEFEKCMESARRVMKERREALRELAQGGTAASDLAAEGRK